jgi:hypothetical protein
MKRLRFLSGIAAAVSAPFAPSLPVTVTYTTGWIKLARPVTPKILVLPPSLIAHAAEITSMQPRPYGNAHPLE